MRTRRPIAFMNINQKVGEAKASAAITVPEDQWKAVHAQRDELIELLTAAIAYVPMKAVYGDIMNKPIEEVRLVPQVYAAIARAKQSNP